MNVVDAFECITVGLPIEARVELFFEALPEELRARFFTSLGRECADRRERERHEAEEVERRRPKPGRRWLESPARNARSLRRDDRDPLLAIAPAAYVEALTGCAVPPGGMIRCPLPGHDDRWPSCRVYDEPERGFYCFGCHVGGTIYDFAAAWWGVGTRGEDFKALRRRLADELLGRVAA